MIRRPFATKLSPDRERLPHRHDPVGPADVINRRKQIQSAIEVERGPLHVPECHIGILTSPKRRRPADPIEITDHKHQHPRRRHRDPRGDQSDRKLLVRHAAIFRVQVVDAEYRAVSIFKFSPAGKRRPRPVERARIDHVRRVQKEKLALIAQRQAVFVVKYRLG